MSPEKTVNFGHESQKHCWRGRLHSCECWRLLVFNVQCINYQHFSITKYGADEPLHGRLKLK